MTTEPTAFRRFRTRAELLAAGWSPSTIRQGMRSGRIERVLSSTYDLRPGAHASDPHVAWLGALQARFGDAAIAVLATAAVLHGLPTPWPSDGLTHVRLPVGREQVQRTGARIHTWQLRDDEVTTIDGNRVTTVERTIVDLMCLTDRFSGMSALDAALHLGMVSVGDVERLAAVTSHRRGAERCRPWWRDADGRSESPLETRVRLRATDGGYPPDELQKRIDVNGRTYFADFAWRRPNGGWLLGEADGRTVHDTPDAVFADRIRGNAIAGTDALSMRFVWGDTARPHTVPSALATVLGPPRSPITPTSP